MKISIKEQAELRHVLAHIIYAIQANAEGHHAEAKYEVDQIEGLVFWEDNESMTKHIEGINYGSSEEVQQEEGLQREEKGLQGKEERLQGQEERLQEQEVNWGKGKGFPSSFLGDDQ